MTGRLRPMSVPADVDLLLEALECVTAAALDVFHEEPGTGTDRLVLGRCSADEYAMARDSQNGYTWRPNSVGRGVPCPADRRSYIDPRTQRETSVGLCGPETFEPWKAGKR